MYCVHALWYYSLLSHSIELMSLPFYIQQYIYIYMCVCVCVCALDERRFYGACLISEGLYACMAYWSSWQAMLKCVRLAMATGLTIKWWMLWLVTSMFPRNADGEGFDSMNKNILTVTAGLCKNGCLLF